MRQTQQEQQKANGFEQRSHFLAEVAVVLFMVMLNLELYYFSYREIAKFKKRTRPPGTLVTK